MAFTISSDFEDGSVGRHRGGNGITCVSLEAIYSVFF